MGTKDALKKLNEEQLYYCQVQSRLIDQARRENTGSYSSLPEYKGKLCGFLDCLRMVGTLSEHEARCLSSYFFERDRSQDDG